MSSILLLLFVRIERSAHERSMTGRWFTITRHRACTCRCSFPLSSWTTGYRASQKMTNRSILTFTPVRIVRRIDPSPSIVKIILYHLINLITRRNVQINRLPTFSKTRETTLCNHWQYSGNKMNSLYFLALVRTCYVTEQTLAFMRLCAHTSILYSLLGWIN